MDIMIFHYLNLITVQDEELFDAHLGASGEGNHLRKYNSFLCSNCRGESHVDFKITQTEYDRFQKLLHSDIDKDNKKIEDMEMWMVWAMVLMFFLALTGLFYIIFKIE